MKQKQRVLGVQGQEGEQMQLDLEREEEEMQLITAPGQNST